MRRYSQMSKDELKEEMRQLRLIQRKSNIPSEIEILKSKYFLAKAYMLSTDDFPPGTYEVTGYSELFEMTYLNGVMGWGSMGDAKEISFPISMLKRRTTNEGS